ncbi:Protein N-acetyltransferase, RimJ/RimL family [Butyrivibrio sp. ob235]|uniref:GNAT family N-acetyltransferase n=1 Tax=Butyrivibrio sp. ob235 TaxID=1761780 RepID=UPI0008C7D683|nr:GNAT family N-acetyltransferase [Butyrivibrio sp. ob235]SEM34077.1 Protein N-acetyltransferase, RimJ/RimL family [Butyrivibrio sp. ob235]
MNIRIMTESDLLNLYGTLSDSEVMKYIEAPYTLDKTKAFLEKAALIEKPLIYAAEDDNGNYIGYVIYHEYEQDTNEIGWILNKSAWGKGFAGKLTEMLIEKIRLDGKNAIIECSPKQEATKHIAGKYGFEYKGQKDGLDTFELKLNRKVDDYIDLIPYYRNDEESFKWYQDPDVCKQVDNVDHVYDIDTLHAMYDFLSSHGNCYYIKYQGRLVGDVSLRDNAELAIVVCKEYQNRHIGRRCILNMIELAREKGMTKVRANIYSFNTQSQRMFKSVGFVRTDDEWFEYRI